MGSTLTMNQSSDSVLEAAIMALKCAEHSERRKRLAPGPRGTHDPQNRSMLSADSVAKYGNLHGRHAKGAKMRQGKQKGSEQIGIIGLREHMP